MTPEEYLTLKDRLIQAGYGDEIQWAETVGRPQDEWTFFCEYAWVVINSGMKNQVARSIWHRVLGALQKGWQVSSVFKHPGKARAIQHVFENKNYFFLQFLHRILDEGNLDWLQTLPWIGPITKYHLAKNLGMDVCKPDRHLVRIASKYGLTPEELCSSLAQATGNRIGTVDLVLWRAANLGMI